MQYDIRLNLHYNYAWPVEGGRHLIRTTPLDLPGIQTVTTSSLEINPRPAERSWFTDFFGNHVAAVSYRDLHETLDLTMRARVVVDRPSARDLSPAPGAMHREIATTLSMDGTSPQHFLCSTGLAETAPEITTYAREVVADTVFATALALCSRIHADFTYDGEATDVGTSAGEAWKLRSGVCQDFSHVMIAGLRGMGIPAGYVSGFIRTIPPPGQERLEGADAMHAWVRVWCGREAGWCEFDPTNAMLAGNDHIVVGYGRDYADVAPIVGVLRTVGRHSAEQSVDVIPVT